MRYIFHFGKYILTRIVWVGKKRVLNRVNSNYDISRTTEPIYMKLCIPVADTQKYVEKKIGAASSTGTGATSHRVFIMIPLIRANERAYWNANISKTTQFIGTKLLRHKAVTQGYVQKKIELPVLPWEAPQVIEFSAWFINLLRFEQMSWTVLFSPFFLLACAHTNPTGTLMQINPRVPYIGKAPEREICHFWPKMPIFIFFNILNGDFGPIFLLAYAHTNPTGTLVQKNPRVPYIGKILQRVPSNFGEKSSFEK